MIKEILSLLAIVSITACKSYSPESQCDPEKNYIKSNPEGIEEFKDLQKKGLVKSIFYNKTNKKNVKTIYVQNLIKNMILWKFIIMTI